MQIRVLYFAVFRERLGTDQGTVTVAAGARVRDAIAALADQHAPIAALRGRFRVAVNAEMVDDDHPLADGDELALIPPVAGGADPRHVALLATPLSLDRCVAAVAGPGMGGVVTFTGMVRRHSHGAQIDHLDYEAYGDMAVRELTRLCDELEAELPGVRVAVEHRTGRLEVGELAVVIAAAAPHRAEAFTACRAMIDRLKERGARDLRVVCLLAAPEGIARFRDTHPDVPIWTAAVDEKLNDHGYIVPGLGDAGDRIFGTK